MRVFSVSIVEKKLRLKLSGEDLINTFILFIIYDLLLFYNRVL